MADREILDTYINLDNSCLYEEEKREIMDMLFKYKEAFSLRDEIGTCPNIEVEIDVSDKSPFYKTIPCKYLKYLTFHLAIIHKHNFSLSSKQRILQGNHG